MAQKKITDLQLIDEVGDDLNIPGDDGIQTYRATAAQFKDYILAADNVGTTQIADASVTLAKLATVLQNALTPSASILAYAGDTAPAGFLLCDGSQVSRTTYAGLYAIVGNRHGSGDGATTFHLPDYRARFLRGRANGSTLDPGRASRTAMNTGGATGDLVGSIQADEVGPHSHSIPVRLAVTAFASNDIALGNAAANSTRSVGLSTGLETRPVNAYVNYIIKT